MSCATFDFIVTRLTSNRVIDQCQILQSFGMQYCIPFDPVSAQYPDRRRSEETRTWDLQSTWQAQRFTNNASHSGVNQLFVDNAPLCIPGNRFPSQTMPRPAFPVLSPNRTSYPAGGYHEPVRFGDLHDTMIQYPSNYDNYYRPHFPIDYNSCCLNHPLQGQFGTSYIVHWFKLCTEAHNLCRIWLQTSHFQF